MATSGNSICVHSNQYHEISAVCNMNDDKGPYDGVKSWERWVNKSRRKEIGHSIEKSKRSSGKISDKGRKSTRVKDMGGKGKLTDFVIGKLQKYYAGAIRRNVGGTVEKLRNDIYSSFVHCSSSDTNPQHHLCPKTTDSLCFYLRSLANNMPVPSHKKMKISFQLSSELRQKVWEEYMRLTWDKILSACLLRKNAKS